tara:strand:+ start:44 stop:295 length:252 start_codon:yes stop_codon:yes gene_type:complete
MEKDLHSLLTYSIIYTERNKGKQKEYPMSDLIIIAEMLETVLLDESMRERVLDAMDLSDKEADRVLKKYISFVNDAIIAEGVK